MDIGPRRGTWLSQTVARHEEAARAYEQFAREVREGRYATPEEAWAAWSGSDELPTPAAVTKTP